MIKRILGLDGPVRMYTKEGSVLMEVSKLSLEESDLTMKGKVMGTMSATAYIRPEELWGMLGLVSVKLVVYLPFLLFRGWWRRKMKQPGKRR